MSHAMQAVIGVVEIAAGAFLDYISVGTAGNSLILAGIGQLLGYAVSLLMNPHRSPLLPIGASYAGTLEPRRIIFGELTVGGMYAAPPMTSGNNNDYLDQVFVGAGHAINAYGDVYLNNLRIANADINAGTGAVTNHVTNNGFEGLVWIRRYDGTQTAADSTLTSTYRAWDSSHKGQGLAYWAIRFQYNQTAFATGVPAVTVHLQGAKLYDPRLDSTNGGSGSQRFATPSTWTYSTNPALCLAWYLTQPLGLGEAFSRIDWSLVAAAANICDEQVSVPIPVVPGLINWVNGGTVQGGIGTNFLRDLNKGQFTQSGSNWLPNTATYILGADGTMYQVASVQTDTQLTLATSYTGATTPDFVSQWNNSTSKTTTQARYTCNATLDATARFEDNVAQLARAMMGQCVYSGGMWRMYAGAWTGSAFALAESDLVGNVSIQCSTPRQNLYNAVRGNYIAASKNYQPDEFPAILNATYVTDDGDTIYTETNFPCCTDMFEAQRNAMIVSRVSRDQKIVTAEFGMSAFGVKVWETGTVTIAEIGWNQQTVRCIGWKFTPRGSVQLTLQEAYSADWTDPAPANYVVAGTNATAAAGLYLPYPPTALTTTSVPGGIQFNLTFPLQFAPGTMVQLYEYTANTPASSATLVWTGTGTQFVLPKSDTVTRYYWALTVGPNGQLSSFYPSGNGVAGAALQGQLSIFTPWIPTANGNVAGGDTQVFRTAATNTWDAGVRSMRGFTNCHISLKPNDYTYGMPIFGLMSAANTASFDAYAAGGNAIYALLQNAILANASGHGGSGNWERWDNGSFVSTLAPIAAGDVPSLTYNSATVEYCINGVPLASATTSGTLYGAVAILWSGDGANSLDYGPTTNLTVIDSGQIVTHALIPRHFGLNSVRGEQGAIGPQGAIAPGSSNVAISYTSTTTSITVQWSAGTIYRSDGTTTAITLGSETITGLTPNTLYNFAVYYDESAAAMKLSTGKSSSTGTPAAAYTAKSADASADLIANGHYTFGWFTGATPSSGGGGGGGGSGCCLHGEQLIELASGGAVHAAELTPNDVLTCPDGPVQVAKLRSEPWGEWFRVTLSNGAELLVAGDHRFIDPTGEQLSARELRLQQVVEARDGYVCVTKLEAVWASGSKISIEVADPHTYYVCGILSHNKNLC